MIDVLPMIMRLLTWSESILNTHRVDFWHAFFELDAVKNLIPTAFQHFDDIDERSEWSRE
jgi:hypothetical protein